MARDRARGDAVILVKERKRSKKEKRNEGTWLSEVAGEG